MRRRDVPVPPRSARRRRGSSVLARGPERALALESKSLLELSPAASRAQGRQRRALPLRDLAWIPRPAVPDLHRRRLPETDRSVFRRSVDQIRIRRGRASGRGRRPGDPRRAQAALRQPRWRGWAAPAVLGRRDSRQGVSPRGGSRCSRSTRARSLRRAHCRDTWRCTPRARPRRGKPPLGRRTARAALRRRAAPRFAFCNRLRQTRPPSDAGAPARGDRGL